MKESHSLISPFLQLRGKRGRPPHSPFEFILENPVFRFEEFVKDYRVTGRSGSAAGVLAWHVKTGRLDHLKRGLYVHGRTWVDPWLIASKMVKDAVISHDGALSFHGATGVGHRVTFMTRERATPVTYNDIIFQPLRSRAWVWSEVERGANRLRVTPLSIAFVDCLTHLELGPPPEELFNLMVSVASTLDVQAMIDHALRTESPLVVSRLAFFLWCSRCPLSDEQLHSLASKGVRVPTYFQRKERTKGDAIVARWNLIVSPELQWIVPRN
jgi:predicted transcriptional regulator of viral defense system